MLRQSLVAMALFAAGCGTATQVAPPATAAAPVSDVTAAPSPMESAKENPFALVPALGQEAIGAVEPPRVDMNALRLGEPPAGLPAAPATCRAFTHRKAAPRPTCQDRPEALEALDTALGEANADKRDASLMALESCAELPAGLVRALRAEFVPSGCADMLNEPLLKNPTQDLRGDVYQTLLGQAIAARMARSVAGMPRFTGLPQQERVLEFLRGPLLTWLANHATAIEQLSSLGAKLPFYARAVVAVEAGLADMRMVEAMRAVPVPEGIQKDPELREVYTQALEASLDPRKTRGRDAALVGLADFAQVGALSDRRVAEARDLLSRLYGGRRINALDGLLLPALPAVTDRSAMPVQQRLAGVLPPFYAAILLEPELVTQADGLRQLLERGISPKHRLALRDAELNPSLRVLAARGRIGLGQLYWRSVDFDEAAAIASASEDGELAEELRFYLALSIALRGGPRDATEMLHRAPLASVGLGNVAALDHVAQARGPFAGIAAYNAALVLKIAAPQQADAAYWNDVSHRFREAAGLVEPKLRSVAEEQAAEADRTAEAIRER